jgi:uncharacterized phage protein gp47/JayE
MPWDRETLPELIERNAAEFESRLPGVLARVRRSMVGVINRTLSGAFDAVNKYVEYLSDQWWVDRCAHEFLVFHGAIWGRPRIPAAPSTGTAQFAGADTSPVPQGTIVQRSDGTQYRTTIGGVIAAGIANIPVEAVSPGQLSNAVISTLLTLTSPVPGVNAVATAFTALAGGADIEGFEAWRARILLRIRKPPQGGSLYDYEAWALEIPGVTRAWPSPKEQGAGTVVLRFVRDDDLAIIPDAGEVAAVQAAIDLQRPVTADTYVVAPIATPQAYTIHLDPDTPTIRTAVANELAALYRREAKPGGTMLISHQREAISTSPGENDHVMSVPSANQTHTTGQLPTLGAITWV